MRLEQVHQTIEAAREERARYLGKALYRGIAHLLRSVQRSLGGQTLKPRRERPAAARRRVAAGELPVQRRKARPKLATSE